MGILCLLLSGCSPQETVEETKAPKGASQMNSSAPGTAPQAATPQKPAGPPP
jgi:hypothetical protein